MANTIKMQALRDSVREMRAAVNHMVAVDPRVTPSEALSDARGITLRTIHAKPVAK